jgi:hypothetical protein
MYALREGRVLRRQRGSVLQAVLAYCLVRPNNFGRYILMFLGRLFFCTLFAEVVQFR